VIAAVMSANPPPVSTLQPMASPTLDRVVRTCLAKSPDDRWQSARDLSRERMWLATGLAVVLVALLSWIAFHLRNEAAPPAMARFQIPAPDKMAFFPWESVDYRRTANIPKLLFEVGLTGGFAGYAVASDGQRFLIPEATDTVRPIDVLANWR
jgi:hypothetical protein